MKKLYLPKTFLKSDGGRGGMHPQHHLWIRPCYLLNIDKITIAGT